MRSARAKVAGFAYYHVMNRVLERRHILLGPVAEKFRALLRAVEAFSGVEVVTYCILENHFHLLLRVPDRPQISDAELLARLAQISSPSVYANFLDRWNRLREQGSEAGLEELRQSVRKRMFDLSFFMKELKLRFSLWYNRRVNRHGPLWEDRFKSCLIQDQPGYLATAAAYIDLNPVRAGIVQDPKDFRFCGYAEALAGQAAARQGLRHVLAGYGVSGTDALVLERYRLLLFGKGAATAQRRGFEEEAIVQVAPQHGALTPWTLAGHRLRWLSDGAVLGSKDFVQALRAQLQAKLGLKRPRGAYPAAENSPLHTLRALRGAAPPPA